MNDPAQAQKPISLSDTDIEEIGQLLYSWTGMIFSKNKRYFIERRIAARMLANNISVIGAYLDFVKSQPGERQSIINAFTINESYFYREQHQLIAMSRQILPELIASKKPGDLIRIWSMPCSNGEEAYSIAIWLLENWALVDAYNIEIVGSDIDSSALDHAREGRFGARALARMPTKVIETYFEPQQGHRRKIITDLQESVRFTAASIVDRSTMAGLGRFDIILCRNLLIYFDDVSRKQAADNLYESLNAGGYLCLGHSESMSRISDRFTLVRLDDAIVYRKI